MSRNGQTYKFSARDHITVIERYLGREAVDEENSFPVKDDFDGRKDYFKVIRCDLLSSSVAKKAKGDQLRRSMIRHDSKNLATAISGLLRY